MTKTDNLINRLYNILPYPLVKNNNKKHIDDRQYISMCTLFNMKSYETLELHLNGNEFKEFSAINDPDSTDLIFNFGFSCTLDASSLKDDRMGSIRTFARCCIKRILSEFAKELGKHDVDYATTNIHPSSFTELDFKDDGSLTYSGNLKVCRFSSSVRDDRVSQEDQNFFSKSCQISFTVSK